MIFFFSCFILPFANAQLREIHLDVTNNNISKICFYKANEGYVAFTNWIGYTTDSGRTFIQYPITADNVNLNGYSVNLTFGFDINGIKAFSKDTLIAYGDYGLVPSILYSVDGGNTFTLVYNFQYNPLELATGITDMVFPQNDNIGYACDGVNVERS